MRSIRTLGICVALSIAVCGLASATGDARLASAIKNRDKAATRALLKQRADVNAPDAEGMTPLLWAAHWNDFDTVKLLVNAGANAKAANRYGVTPLHEACTVGNAPMIETLLKAGADPNATFGEGETPLMTAARTGNVEAVKMLYAFGAQVNAREEFRGQTALMWAVAENHAAVVRTLIEVGADVNSPSIKYEFPNLVGGNGGIIHDRPEGGLTPLMFSARQGALEAGRVLLDAGAEVNASESQYGFTAMQTAIFNGHYDFAALLIERGADVNDGSLYTAIEMRNLATYSNRPNPPELDRQLTSLDVIKILLARGADPNRSYTKKIPPRQAQGDIVVPPGATPLYRATRATDLTTIRLLLDNGAKPSVATKDGSTPLMVAAGLGARRTGDEEFVEKAARADPLDAARMFVDAGAEVNAANDAGNTAMHYAALTGATRIVEYLAANGANLEVKNKQGKTPLDLARQNTAAVIRKFMGVPSQQ